jgi:hypothetical protein
MNINYLTLKNPGRSASILLLGRKQRVIIEGQASDWREVNAGVPQGSVLGPLFFLIYINDITDLQSSSFLYADDTSLLDIVDDPIQTTIKLNDDLELINMWTKKWFVKINPDKTKSMIFSVKRQKPLHPQLKYDKKLLNLLVIDFHQIFLGGHMCLMFMKEHIKG